ncbi:hypothetical protein AMTRI_Chr05g61850 [Amborella trichopoda]
MKRWVSGLLVGKEDYLLHIALFGAFAALCARSVGQQREIETLEWEKEELQNKNKALKNTMWQWKQHLFSQTSHNPALSLSRLKTIYGEVDTQTPQGSYFCVLSLLSINCANYLLFVGGLFCYGGFGLKWTLSSTMCSMVIMLCTKRIIHAYTLCRWVGDLRGHPRGGRGLRLEEVDVVAVEGGRLNRRRVGKVGEDGQ